MTVGNELDPIRRMVNEIVERDLMRKELTMLRKVLWMLAHKNGGGISFYLSDLDAVSETALLDAWVEHEPFRTGHIRATVKGRL